MLADLKYHAIIALILIGTLVALAASLAALSGAC